MLQVIHRFLILAHLSQKFDGRQQLRRENSTPSNSPAQLEKT